MDLWEDAGDHKLKAGRKLMKRTAEVTKSEAYQKTMLIESLDEKDVYLKCMHPETAVNFNAVRLSTLWKDVRKSFEGNFDPKCSDSFVNCMLIYTQFSRQHLKALA